MRKLKLQMQLSIDRFIAGPDGEMYRMGTFVSALIKTGLIDEFHLFFNPTAFGKGTAVFKRKDKS